MIRNDDYYKQISIVFGNVPKNNIRDSNRVLNNSDLDIEGEVQFAGYKNITS
jgi:hypothetical protein